MKMALLTAVACAAAIGVFYHKGLAATGLDAPVRTTAGLVRADPTPENGVRVFRGIPFAAPPVGDRRWKEPAPPAKWEGVREARTFSKECVQAPSTDPLYSLYYPTEQPQGEDCLYINVWTPARSPQDRLAVLVWIYGGGFVLGSGSQPVYNPVNLAKRGIVAVTFNYRVGIMGFFAHPELAKESGHDSSGNYGFLDQIAALKWVHNNIAAFGGDPNRITIAGHSAGAGSSSVLAVSPLAKGLVHRAIPQSLAPGRAIGNARRMPRKDVEKAGEAFATQLGASNIAELRKKSSAEIMAGPNARGFGFSPLVDGYVLPYDVETSYTNGTANDVQLMVGEVKDTVQLAASGRSHVTPEDLKKQVEQQFGTRADEFFRLFPIPPGADGGDVSLKNANDAQGYWRAWKLAALHARYVKSPTYLYHFTRVPPASMSDYHGVPGATPGSFHGAELSYMFDNLAYKKWAWTDGDRKLTDIMSSYWLNFINKGDPNGPGLPAWAKFTTTGQETIQLGDSVAPFRGPTEVINFFETMPGTVGP